MESPDAFAAEFAPQGTTAENKPAATGSPLGSPPGPEHSSGQWSTPATRFSKGPSKRRGRAPGSAAPRARRPRSPSGIAGCRECSSTTGGDPLCRIRTNRSGRVCAVAALVRVALRADDRLHHRFRQQQPRASPGTAGHLLAGPLVAQHGPYRDQKARRWPSRAQHKRREGHRHGGPPR